MNLWDEIIGQSAAIELLRTAATNGEHRSAMSHAWLFSGPPGSGRSNIAYAFAAALIGGSADPDDVTVAQVVARSHPDLHAFATEGVLIKREDVRQLIARSHYSPSVGSYRVIVIEDADRMTEQTSNVLLKELEEPAERTVWLLCAPSEADLLPTITSRVRSVRLLAPAVSEVAELLERRHGVDAKMARHVARVSQSHVGMATRLAASSDARDRRTETLRIALSIKSSATAVEGAARLLEIATADAEALTAMRDEEERLHLLRSLGVTDGQAIPPGLRTQVRALEDDQKRRATRSKRDGIDRILVDIASLFRDVLLMQLGVSLDQVNEDFQVEISSMAGRSTAEQSMHVLKAVGETRERIDGNVSPLIALEAFMVSTIRR